jgi:hypothetical protein
MKSFNPYSLPLLIAGLLLVSGCATPQGGSQQMAAACASKWIAAGNNGAKADRYVQTSC